MNLRYDSDTHGSIEKNIWSFPCEKKENGGGRREESQRSIWMLVMEVQQLYHRHTMMLTSLPSGTLTKMRRRGRSRFSGVCFVFATEFTHYIQVEIEQRGHMVISIDR